MFQNEKFTNQEDIKDTFTLRYGQDVDIFRQFKKVSKNKDEELKKLRIELQLFKFLLESNKV